MSVDLARKVPEDPPKVHIGQNQEIYYWRKVLTLLKKISSELKKNSKFL